MISLKSGWDLRLRLDLRCFNEAIWVDTFPLPILRELMSSVGDATIFSTIDLNSAYHQIEVDGESKHCKGFITREGTLQYKRMIFWSC